MPCQQRMRILSACVRSNSHPGRAESPSSGIHSELAPLALRWWSPRSGVGVSRDAICKNASFDATVSHRNIVGSYLSPLPSIAIEARSRFSTVRCVMKGEPALTFARYEGGRSRRQPARNATTSSQRARRLSPRITTRCFVNETTSCS